MNNDELTYRRGTTAALAGLAVQVVLCVATGLIGAWAQSPAIQAATWHIAGGIPIWIILAIIYQQHRVERTESLAAEKLATQDATSAAIFGETSDELQLARNRLDRLYAYGLPVVSFAVVPGWSSILRSTRRRWRCSQTRRRAEAFWSRPASAR